MNLTQLLDRLRHTDFMENVTHWETIPARPAQYAPFPEGLDARIPPVLNARGIERLYTHQAQALAEAARLRLDFTDDSQLYERLGLPVHMTMGAYTNLKLTTPEDFALAEALDGMDAWMEPRGGAR